MRIYLLLFVSLSVAVGIPVQDWVPVESFDAPQRERNPLLGDLLPKQGHVVQEDPKPVVRKELLVQVKPVKSNPVQQNELVKSRSVVDDVPVVKKVEAEENEVLKEVETQEVHQINPNELVKEPVIETEPEETFVEDEGNVGHEVASIEGEEPVMGLKPEEISEVEVRNIMQKEALIEAAEAPVMEEVHQINPNELVEEPVVELEPEETFVEDGGNVVQEVASMEREEPVMETEPEETLEAEERNFMQEVALMDAAEAPVMELDPVLETQEVHQINPNEFVEEPVVELEPEETFVEDEGNVVQEVASMEGEEPVMETEPEETLEAEERNIMQEEALLDAAEAPVMELDPVLETQEVHQINPNEFVEEPVVELEPEETFVEDEGNVLQDEALLEGEEPVMETEPEETFVEDEGNVLQEEASMEGEEPVMGLKPEETLEVEVRNIMQEEALLDAEKAPAMELDPVLETQEVHQINPNESVEEPVVELEPEESFVEDEGNAMQEEALMGEPEGAEGPAMPDFGVIEPNYYTAQDPMLEYEPLQEDLLMQYNLHRVKKSAEPNMMMADQSYLGGSLLNKNAGEEREFSDAEPSDSDSSNNRWRTCTGVVIDGKCYVFFRGPKKAPDAQFFCQDNFPSGNLASVTSSYIHSHMMGLMDRNGGRTRTWIGGLRYLDTGRFIWLDGARWHYADWLPGEPNNTAGVENCVELLSNGKFNDMPCWDLRAFICSYPY